MLAYQCPRIARHGQLQAFHLFLRWRIQILKKKNVAILGSWWLLFRDEAIKTSLPHHFMWTLLFGSQACVLRQATVVWRFQVTWLPIALRCWTCWNHEQHNCKQQLLTFEQHDLEVETSNQTEMYKDILMWHFTHWAAALAPFVSLAAVCWVPWATTSKDQLLGTAPVKTVALKWASPTFWDLQNMPNGPFMVGVTKVALGPMLWGIPHEQLWQKLLCQRR